MIHLYNESFAPVKRREKGLANGVKTGESGYSPPYLLYHFWDKKKSLFLHYKWRKRKVLRGMENVVDFSLEQWYDKGGERGRHPSQKTLFTAVSDKRGVSAMQKTIAVVDEMGHQYEATYPRRARGLVKKGRARFIAEDCICLVRPPEKKKTEDTPMNMTAEQILEKMTEVLASTQYVESALATLQNMEGAEIGKECYAPPDVAGEARAKAISDIVTKQLGLNHQVLNFLERMYDDLREDMKAAQSTADNQA